MAGVRRVTDLTATVPNLSINSGYRQGSIWISLRGIPSVQGGEPPVSVLIDGVQVPGQDFINEELGELQSVQVLRGPQGAIYGRGAIGGAILIETQRPTDELSGNASLSYGRNNDVRGIGSISGALSDRVRGRLTVLARSTDGLQPNLTTGDKADDGHGVNVNGRLFVDLAEDFTLDLNARHQTGIDGASYEYLVDDVTRYDYRNRRTGVVNDPNVEDDHEITSVSAKFDKDFGAVTLTSITQYAESMSKLTGDGDFSADHVFLQDNRIGLDAINQDLRLASNGDGDFNWMVGAFFQDRETTNWLHVTADPLGSMDPGVLYSNSDQHDKSYAWAVYTQGAYKLPGEMELSVAARYDSDRRTSYDALNPSTRVRETFSAFQPQVTLRKEFSSSVNAYATVGRGFRSGGFNPYADTVLLGVERQYDSEKSTSYEIGLKTTWLGGDLTLNGAIFHTDFDNQQFFYISAVPVARDIFTIDETKIDGAELEVNYSPITDLTLAASLGYNDSSIEKFQNGGFDGNTSPNSYDYTGSTSLNYKPQLTADVAGLVYLDWQRRGSTYFDVQNRYSIAPTNTFNGRIGVEFDGYQISLYGRNLTDERFPVLFQADAAGVGTHGQLLNMPRTYGVEVKAKF